MTDFLLKLITEN